MKLKKISWLPVIIMMGIIFTFSSKPAVNSRESSMTIANSILNIYENFTDTRFQGTQRTDKLGIIDHIIRKGAHFTEYAILAGTIFLHFSLRNRKGIKLILLSVALTAMYAATDEFHQLFVPGRSGEIKDVLIDTAGALTGVIILNLIINLFARKNRHIESVTLLK